jgi:MFS family permease
MQGPFGHRGFRRLFAGRVVTNVGDSLYFVAAMWLVYRLTGDPVYSGIAGFLTLAPAALQFLVGPLVDRWPLRETLVATQVVQAVFVLVVPAAAFVGLLSVWVILVVMPLLSLFNQVVYPAQSAALPRLLEDDDLVAANSVFSVAYQGVDVVANALGGVLIAVVGGITLFAVDAVTFVAAASLFGTVRIPAADSSATESATSVSDEDAPNRDPVDPAGSARSRSEHGTATDDGQIHDGYIKRLRSGARVVRRSFLAPLIVGGAVANFTVGGALAAMPAYADAIGGASSVIGLGEAGTYGILMAALAAGSFLGAVAAGTVADRPLGHLLVGGFVLSGGLWALAVGIDWLPATAVLLVGTFIPAGVVNVQLAATVQAAVPDDLVGRVSSLLGSATAVAVPLGSLAGGIVAGEFGPRAAMYLGAAGVAAFALYVLGQPSLRGLPAATEIALDTTWSDG